MINGMMTMHAAPSLPEGTYMMTIGESEVLTDHPVYGYTSTEDVAIGALRPSTFKGSKINQLLVFSWVDKFTTMSIIGLEIMPLIPQKEVRIQLPTYNDTVITLTDEGEGVYALRDAPIIDTLVEALKKGCR